MSLSVEVHISASACRIAIFCLRYFFDVVRNQTSNKNIYLLELIKKRSKVREKNMSHKRDLNFDRWKAPFENYMPIKVWFRIVYKITKNICRSRLLTKFVQTQKRYLTSLNKITNLMTTCHIKQNWTYSNCIPRKSF